MILVWAACYACCYVVGVWTYFEDEIFSRIFAEAASLVPASYIGSIIAPKHKLKTLCVVYIILSVIMIIFRMCYGSFTLPGFNYVRWDDSMPIIILLCVCAFICYMLDKSESKKI